jgi:7,8-dihydropterin-6-yl-methyl-4-(beta-D-ribofuranosyl)aminobenzene 5'-phosphate synthase
LPLLAHPAAFETKLKLHPRRRDIGAPFSREALEAAGFETHLSTEPVEVAPDLWTTGEVPRHHRLEEEAVAGFFAERDGAVVADTIPDDLSLIVLHGDGAFSLICGCCHAGLLNTLDHASTLVPRLVKEGGGAGPPARSGGSGPSPPARVRAIIGGLHTTGASDARLEHTIAGLRKYDPAWIAPIHCSGQREAAIIHEALGERVRYFAVGDVVRL